MPRWILTPLEADGTLFFMADMAVKGTIVLCLALVIAGCLRRSSAAVRHRLWSLALRGLIVMPLLSWLIPGWGVPVLHVKARPAGSHAIVDRLRPASAADETMSETADSRRPETGDEVLAVDLRMETSSATATMREPIFARFASSERLIVKCLLVTWAAGLVVDALPTLIGIIVNEWRRRRSPRVSDSDSLNLLNRLCRQLALRRTIELRKSRESLIPLTWGIVRPVILLPELAERWPEPARRLVLLHELAHIQRFDVALQLAGRLAAALYWFHPLAWYALHRSRVECECACDDCVIETGERPSEYAQQLLNLARSLRMPRLSTAVAMARANTLEQRMKVLFDEGQSHVPLGRRSAKMLLAGAAVVLVGLAAIHPEPSVAESQTSTVQPAATTAASKSSKAGQSAPASPKSDPTKDNTHPITVTGRALDSAGKPIPRARIYLASKLVEFKRLAETTADALGRYQFRDVPLPIKRADSVGGHDAGAFEVFGQAEGFGFAWRPKKSYCPQRMPVNPAIRRVDPPADPPEGFEAEDKIELDLTFSPPARLSGIIVDERGNAIPNARLAIRDCEPVDAEPGKMQLLFHSLNETETVPPEMKVRTTGADGRFEFTGLPVDCLFRIDVRPKGFATRMIRAATTGDPEPDYQGLPVLTGELNLTFITPVDIPIKVVFDDTGEPASKVHVNGYNHDPGASSYDTTDADGHAVLRLPTGEYRLNLLPARGTAYLETEAKLVVGKVPPADPIVARLDAAAVIDVTVVDAATGEGIPEVDLWRQNDLQAPTNTRGGRELLSFRSWEVETRTAWVEHPRTDVNGKLRALVVPGIHRIGVALQSYPKGYVLVEGRGKKVECDAGKPVEVKFRMRKLRAGGQEDAEAPPAAKTLTITITAAENGQMSSIAVGLAKLFNGPLDDARIRQLDHRLKDVFAIEGTFDQVLLRVDKRLSAGELLKVIHICNTQTKSDGELVNKISFVELGEN